MREVLNLLFEPLVGEFFHYSDETLCIWLQQSELLFEVFEKEEFSKIMAPWWLQDALLGPVKAQGSIVLKVAFSIEDKNSKVFRVD